MTITTIFTGGTIGSAVSGTHISLDDSSRFALIDGYRRQHGDEVTFFTRSPYTILSENLSADAINALLDAVAEEEAGDSDGIVVTHGTDTLAYTAAALALRFPKPRCPIIVVSANYPLDDPRTNGHSHFEAAVSYIRDKLPPLTLVAYRNPHENAVTLHHADSIYLQPELAEEVIGMTAPAAVFANGQVQAIDTLPRDRDPMTAHYPADSKVLVVTAVPGMGYPYDLGGIKAVLFRPYHSGTLPTAAPALTAFCQKATAHGIPLYISGTGQPADYESTAVFEALGITRLPKCTLAAAYMRLWGM